MGYESILAKFPRYKNFNERDFYAISHGFEYETSEWAQNNYHNRDEYVMAMCNRSYDPADYEELGPYSYRNQYGSISIGHDFGFWCSDSKSIFSEITLNFCEDTGEDSFELSESQVKLIIDWLANAIKEDSEYVRYVERSWRYGEDNSIISTKCDGIELLDDNDRIIRMETCGYEYMNGEGNELYVVHNKYNHFTLLDMLTTFTKALIETDFNNERLIFYCSY